ncbi:hypothetical protein KUTeg_014494 [Tegillarca granosa]|uniref:HNF-p1 domain-containing protein n=1 Tax=Tegillarca granosa TaxID=220873 RepID=A0ABQ9ERV4_TEGGR|nr:hypothetical protein KUTeg_014494 [Tegillarca granosa]
MSGTVIGHQMFTIEQIELIRRLRNSGITKEQVVKAFDSLERLDKEFGSLYNVPRTSASIQNNHNNSPSNGSLNNIPRTFTSSHSSLTSAQPSSELTVSLNSDSSSTTTLSSQTAVVSLERNTGVSSAIVQNLVQTVSQGQSLPRHQIPHHIQQSYRDQPFIHQQQSEQVPLHAYTSNQGNQSIHKSNHSGVLHTALLNAQPQQSDCTVERGIKRQHSECVDFDGIESPLSFDDDGNSITGLNSLTEEEFDNTTSQEHGRLAADVKLISSQNMAVVDQFLQGNYHEIPEKSFQSVMNAYLSYRKSLINTLQSKSRARHLPDREKVTTHIILNWFANRRKEVKRIAREEGISTSSVVLPSRISTHKNSTSSSDIKTSPDQPHSDYDHIDNTENTSDSIDNIRVF